MSKDWDHLGVQGPIRGHHKHHQCETSVKDPTLTHPLQTLHHLIETNYITHGGDEIADYFMHDIVPSDLL